MRSIDSMTRSAPRQRKESTHHDCAGATVLFDPLVDRGSVFFGQAIAHKVVVDPHEPADYPALIVPPPHHRLHLAGGVVLVPNARENRHFAEIPTRAWIVSPTAGIGLKMYSVY